MFQAWEDMLTPNDTSDDSTVGHDWTGELNQDRALSPYTRSRQPAKILNLGAFAPVSHPFTQKGRCAPRTKIAPGVFRSDPSTLYVVSRFHYRLPRYLHCIAKNGLFAASERTTILSYGALYEALLLIPEWAYAAPAYTITQSSASHNGL
jgi:hypothetical protein